MTPNLCIFSLLCSLVVTIANASPDLTEFDRWTNQSLLWGPYRPNLYFGIRPRIPDGPLVGLLWTNVEDYQSIQKNLRYTCEQHAGVVGYGWDRYDPRSGGIQTIHDAENSLDITTSFIKHTSPGEGNHAGRWAVRVKGTPRPGASEHVRSTFVISVAASSHGLINLEADGDQEDLQDHRGIQGPVTIKAEHPILGNYKILVSEGKGARPTHDHASAQERALDRTFVSSATLPEDSLWQTRPMFLALLKQSIEAAIDKYGQDDLPPPFQLYTIPNKPDAGNIQLIQKVFSGAFEFDIIYNPESSQETSLGNDIDDHVGKVVNTFDQKFDKVFRPQCPFRGEKPLNMSKSLFSNLLGGIGYFHGDWLADRSNAPEYEEDNEGFWQEAEQARSRAIPSKESAVELFTSIPSRPFFPRGFLWDEGFHLIPIVEWDVDLALEVVRSWFRLIDEDGWIAREQILGEEARSKVPAEFQVQHPTYANPPTLFFVITTYIDRLVNGHDSAPSDNSILLNRNPATKYLAELYPLLKRHYDWFRTSQKGDLKTYERDAFSSKEGYRWRGRTQRHCLPSGMDDYPRAQPPHPGELHVDAISWVGLMAQSLRKIAVFLGESDDASRLAKQEEAIARNINDLHWSETDGVYCDASIDQFEEEIKVCHKGYVSLTPFLVGLLKPDDAKVEKLLDLISDPNELWSSHGIRSLSRNNEHYGTAENYWRGPVWINMNYLILQRLLEVAQSDGPYHNKASRIYSSLRQNLVDTVSKSWEDTGFAWEQYNPETGAGQRTQHFTGWTSLIVKIMAMPDLTQGKVDIKDEL